MDELLHHCLRELSFDGDLGCNVSRLGDFINDFYNHSFTARGQKVDDAFCAFVWSLVVQQPTVRVGTIPDGITSEVWIAPQTSAKRKANAKGEEHVEVQPAELILVPDAKSTPLAELQEEYGDKLRIASNPDAIYASITGSHIRFPKMSPMVYSALQIITRGRDDGVTVVQLGQQSKYDQKTCFYLVKQLTELNLVVKVRRGGVGTHFVIHRYFFERSPSWKAIREEEISAELTRKGAEQPKPDVPDEEEKDKETADSLNFTPIDARHLSSLPLVRARVVKLLKASRNHMHVSSNMLLTIGFSNPTKTDRRFFQSRIRELVQQGILEKVIVPNSRKKSSSVLCLRLVDEKGSSEGKDDDDDDDDVVVLRPQDDKDEEDFSQDGVKMNMTIHKQIIDLLEQSGTTGMTLNELSSALCNFDKRTIELLLTRAEKFPPPTHLSDLGIAGLMETSGRERRHRYFTVSAYRTLVAREGLDQSTAGYGDVDLSQAEQFMSVEADAFYDNEASLEAYQDAFKEEISGKGGKGKKSASTASANAVKRTKSKKRAREEDGEPSASTRKGKKRKVAADDGEGAEGSISVGPVGMNNEAASKTPSIPKKRGRVAKDTAASEGAEGSISSAPKRRGRPPKDPAGASATPKKRGRPRKNPVVSAPAEPSGESADTPVATSSVAITQDVSGITPENGDQDRERLPSSAARNSRVQSEMSDGEDPTPLPESTLSDGQVAGVQPMQEERDGTEQRGLTTLPVDASATEGPDSGHVQTMDVDTVAEYDPSSESMHISADEPAQVNRQPDTDVQMASDEAALSGISPDRPAGVSTQQPTRAASLAPVVLAQSQSTTPRLSQAARDVPQPGPSRLMPGTQPAQSRGRVNVSNLRRENELLRVVEIMGGIVNIQTKEIYDTHMTLLETLAKEGEPTSSPVGIRTDKRTVASTFSSLESRGKIKQVTASIPSHLGMTRPTVVVYLPTVDQEKVTSFLAELSRSAPPPVPSPYGRKISEPLDYGADATRLTKNALPLQLLQLEKPGTDNNERWIKNAARADQLFALDEATIREVLLTERTTIGQYHGTIVAKMLRARELHLSLLKAFETGASSAQIVSHGQRIIKIDYLCQELPLGLYCKLVPALQHCDELARFMSTEEGLNTIVKDLPDKLLSALQIGRSRARTRILDSLEILRCLYLATPLRPSTSPTPWLTCQPNGEHPVAFDKDPLDGWTPGTPSAAPSYWVLTNKAPIYHWARSETTPPFLQDVSIDNLNHALQYWSTLREACVNKQLAVIDAGCNSSVGPPEASQRIAKALRRRVSWNTEYVMTWHQTQYLKKFYEVSNGNTPLDLDDAEDQINKISWVVSAPQEVVREYYASIRIRLKAEMAEVRKRRKKDSEKWAELEAKASLVKKAQEARQHRENEWEELMKRVHPEPLSKAALARVKRIQNQFFQSTAIDTQKWEIEIQEAVREAEIVSKKPLKPNRRIAPAVPVKKMVMLQGLSAEAPPLASNPPEKSIASLIAEQGPAAPPKPPAKKKRKRSDSEADQEETKKTQTRRHRFQWNRDYDELARDASAIIKARCRDAPRLDWGAYEQVLPAVPRNTVRQRVAHLREIPGNETYLNRLEQRWYELWQQHRGTEHLPDDDPTHATNFDLIKHIEFLRKHIDKNALRVGYAQPQHNVGVTIPDTVEKLLEQYDVTESSTSGPTYDFVWNALVEEGREKRLLNQPFVTKLDDLSFEDASTEVVSLAESALKMVLGTPNEVYESDAASQLLHSVGEKAGAAAQSNLLNRGFLSKLVRDTSKPRPGRVLKISEVNQNALGGPINRDIFQDAATLEDLSAEEEGVFREWPLLATDGDMASLIQLVSDDKVAFEIDTSHPQAMRPALDWNSKKADDDQIETAIQVSFHGLTIPTANLDLGLGSPPVDISMTVDGPSAPSAPLAVHGKMVDGSPGCCRHFADRGVIDCSACLDETWNARSATLTPADQETGQFVLFLVAQAGENGVTKEEFLVNTKVSEEDLLRVLAKMTEEPVPLLNWIGYNSSFLISSAQSRLWTVSVSENPMMRVLPRRWLDIFGGKISDVWEAALKAVVGTIVFRPGISQTELYWRLRSVYDRQEIIDLLRALYEEGFLRNYRVIACSVSKIESTALGALGREEEKRVFWFVDESKHWYHI